MNRQPKLTCLLMRTVFRISATTLLALGTAWAADPLIQPEDIRQLSASKLFISSHNHLQRVRINPDSWQATNDGGNSWTTLSAPFAAQNAVHVAFHPEGKPQLFASSDHGDAAYFDGASWSPVRLPEESVLIVGAAPPVLLQPLSANGRTYTRLLLGTPRGLQFANLAHADGVPAPSFDNRVLWQLAKLPALPVTALALAPSGNRIAVGFASGHLALVDDDPAIPSRVSSSLPKASSVRSLAFHPFNEADLMATFADSADTTGWATRRLYHSLDAGQSWVPLILQQTAASDPVILRVALPDGAQSLLASDHKTVSVRDSELLTARQNAAGMGGLIDTGRALVTSHTPVPGQITSHSPTSKCKVLSATPLSLLDAGGRVVITLGPANECKDGVKLTSSASFVPVPSGTIKSSTITLQVAPNNTLVDRSATVTISLDKKGPKDELVDGGTLKISQKATLPCLVLSAEPLSLPASGGNVTINLRLTPACGQAVKLTSSASFVPVPSGAVTATTITLSVKPDTDPLTMYNDRSATVTISGSTQGAIDGGTITILQKGAIPPCKLTLIPASDSYSYQGGYGSLKATMTGNCPAGATLQVAQRDLQLFYSGPPSVPYIPFFVPANMPPPYAPFTITPGRSFAIGAELVGGGQFIRSNTVTITQGAFQLPEENLCVQDSELKGSIQIPQYMTGMTVDPYVSAGPYCRWNVQGIQTLDPDKEWATVKSTVNNIGPGGLIASVRGLTEHTRRGFFTVALRRREVYQQGTKPTSGCASVSASLNDATPVGAGGGERTLNITAPGGCSYSLSLSGATAMATLLDPTEGVANGLLRIRILPNTTGTTRSMSFQIIHSGPATPAVTLTQR